MPFKYLFPLRLSFTLMLLFLYSSLFAGVKNNDVDSIKNIVVTSLKNQGETDTTTINNLNKLAADYFQSNPDSALFYGQKGVDLSRKIHYEAGVANGLLQTGRVNYFRGKSAAAQLNFDEAITIFKRLNDDKGLSKTYVSLGRMYNLLASYGLALQYINKALELDKQLKDNKGITDCYKNIGVIYYSQGQLSKALDYLYKGLFLAVKYKYTGPSAELYNDIGLILQSMEVYPKALDHFHKALSLFNGTKNYQAIGTVKENIGEVLIAQGNYNQAIYYLNASLKTAKKQEDVDGLCSLYTDLGLSYAHKGQNKVALAYLDTSVTTAVKYKYVSNQANAIIGITTVYNMQKDYASAFKYAVDGQALAVKLGNLAVRANATLQLSKTLAGLGKFEDAYKYLSLYNNLRDKLKGNESLQKLTSYNYELNFTAKEHQLAEQQRENNLVYQQKIDSQFLINIIFLVIIVAMVAILWNYYRQKRKQQKINAMLEEKNHEVLEQKVNIDEQAGKLNELNKLKDRLISVLAHDLRAPLSTLRGLFDLLQDETISHQEMLKMIPAVLKKLEYTSDFLDTLLFWINSQMDTFVTSAVRFSVKEVALHEVEVYTEQAASKGISLTYNMIDDLYASADPNSIRIVIRNLITNAIKFSRKNDTIEVHQKQDDQHITISIKDTGLGMSTDQLNKLFKSKVDSKSGTNNELGTGMGLLFCKDLVEKCNGEIWVNSQLGIGTSFSFTIPIDHQEVETIA